MNIPQEIKDETQAIIEDMTESSNLIEATFNAIWDGKAEDYNTAANWFCTGWAISVSAQNSEYERRIAELERQLGQRTGRVHSANQQIDAVLQPSYTVALSGDDIRLWAQ